ncbi:MAG: ankyrin repeat domain-containing protein [Tatlockia sp.]|nr:ankyrin repeat domain-containing protein [Tatlockia sp.]
MKEKEEARELPFPIRFLREKEEAKKLEETRKQQIAKMEIAREREEARKLEDVRKQEIVKKEEARKQEEVRKLEYAKKQEEAKREEDKPIKLLDARSRDDTVSSRRHENAAKGLEKRKNLAQNEVEIRTLHGRLIEEIKKCPPSLEEIKTILMKGADINFLDKKFQSHTLLMTAIAYQNDHIAEYLLNHGANPLVENIYGEIASDFAACNSSIYTLLRKRERELRLELLSPSEKYSLLLQDYICSSDAKLQQIEEYLALGAEIDYQNLDGSTALMISVEAHNVLIVEYLLKNGANPFLKNKYGKTAKFLSSRNDEFFQLLKGYEFLFAAIEDNHFMMNALLKADKSIIDFQGKDGYTALLIATELGAQETIEFLLEQGADAAITCDDGKGIMELTNDESILALFLQEQEEDVVDENFEAPKRYSFFDYLNKFESSSDDIKECEQYPL